MAATVLLDGRATPETHYRPAMAESPIIIGPVTGGRHGWAFGSTVVDLDAAGYREEEYLLRGNARRYRLLAGSVYPADGVWPAEEVETRPYTTRVVVRRPIDAARFNGTMLVSWNNVSSGYEALSELTP